MEAIGRKRWAIPEGYIPSESSFSDRALVSHETACILNAGDDDAHVTITILFADREPVGPYRLTVAARRTLHLRFNDLRLGVRIGHADHRAAHPARFPAFRGLAVVDGRVS